MAAQRKRSGAKRGAAAPSSSKSPRSRGRRKPRSSLRALVLSFPPLLTAVIMGLTVAILLLGFAAPSVKDFALSEADKVISELRILSKTLHDLKESVLSRQGAEPSKPSKPVEHRRPIIEKNLTS